MTQKDFYLRVEDDLNEGYPVALISKKGFKMLVSFSSCDKTGEYYYTAHGIEGSKFAHISETFTIRQLEKFVIKNGFEIYDK